MHVRIEDFMFGLTAAFFRPPELRFLHLLFVGGGKTSVVGSLKPVDEDSGEEEQGPILGGLAAKPALCLCVFCVLRVAWGPI